MTRFQKAYGTTWLDEFISAYIVYMKNVQPMDYLSSLLPSLTKVLATTNTYNTVPLLSSYNIHQSITIFLTEAGHSLNGQKCFPQYGHFHGLFSLLHSARNIPRHIDLAIQVRDPHKQVQSIHDFLRNLIPQLVHRHNKTVTLVLG